MPYEVALNVFVSTMSAPAAKYARWIPAITSGRVKASRSLHPFKGLGWSRNRSPR